MSKLNWTMRACGIYLVWAMMAVASHAQTFTTLHSFDGKDGQNPHAALVQGTDGNFYGTTFVGGANSDGTVFKITSTGTLKTVASLSSTDGDDLYAALVLATNGDFYGTAYVGGGANFGGTIYRVTPSGTLTALYLFCFETGCPNGADPYAGLVQGTDGNFYGTSQYGGAGLSPNGTIFKITPSGRLATLYSFCSLSNCADGDAAHAGLVQATNGDFYGTTSGGGANLYYGTVFSITPSGMLTTLHSFDFTDGALPYANLVQGTDGNFYGTTSEGGTGTACNGSPCGTIFTITPTGTLTTLHTFTGTDGNAPYAGLVLGTDGTFYGTTEAGGANGGGTIFKITTSGALTTLYTFCSQNGCTDGEQPFAGLVQATNGNFYGTTEGGGDSRLGTVFSLSVGLGPFVKTLPTSGKVGATVKILGTKLTGATSVTFNGTAAAFKAVSSSEITTTVPVGATTGTVQVVTPTSGTLSSNVPFTVN